MSNYTIPIIRYGLIAPLLAFGISTAILFIIETRVQRVHQQKQIRYNEQMTRLDSIRKIEDEIRPKRHLFQEQNRLLQLDPTPLFAQLSDATVAKYQPLALERTGMLYVTERGRFARYIEGSPARIKASFEGGFGPMQETLLQVESLIPHVILEELKISRKVTSLPNSNSLIFELSYIFPKIAGDKP